MAVQDARALQEAVQWQFTLQEQSAVSRFGTLNGEFWKQYLSHGIPFPELHPPKKILPKLYDLALKWSLRR